MKELTNHEKVVKYQVVSVPFEIKNAKVEILTFRGAPAFLGTKLAKLYYDDGKFIILHSKMSGVVNRVLVNNDEIVFSGQRLFELRNTNITRTRTGHKMKPHYHVAPKPSCNFFSNKEEANQEEIDLATIYNDHLKKKF